MWCMTSYHVHMHHFLGVTGRMLLCIFDSRICKARSVLTPCGTTQYVTIRYDTYRIFLYSCKLCIQFTTLCYTLYAPHG